MELHNAKFYIEKFGSIPHEKLGKKELAQLIVAMQTINVANGKFDEVGKFPYHRIREMRKPKIIQIAKITTLIYERGA